MTTYSRVAVVTGSNKGLGLGIVRHLALQYPKSTLNNGPFLIYLTSRDKQRGETALKSIHEDKELVSSKLLRSHGGLTEVKHLLLDIDSEESIEQFANQLKKNHPHGIDIFVNNAGIALDGFDANVVKKTLGSNYFGTLNLSSKILPLIPDGGRLVNVASQLGYLRGFSDTIKKRFVEAKSIDDVSHLMNEFIAAVEKGDWKSDWPSAAYKVSKAGVIAMTRVLAAEERAKGSKTLINACCPGYVATDMTKHKGTKTVDQGIETPIWLALGDIQGTSGEFWVDSKPVDWVHS